MFGPAALAIAAAAFWTVVVPPGTLAAAWVRGVGLTAAKIGTEYRTIAAFGPRDCEYARAGRPRRRRSG